MGKATHVYAELSVPREVWELIWSKLNDAGYYHAIDNDEGLLLMDGIALVVEKEDRFAESSAELVDLAKEAVGGANCDGVLRAHGVHRDSSNTVWKVTLIDDSGTLHRVHIRMSDGAVLSVERDFRE